MRSGRKAETPQRGVQGARGDGSAVGGEDPGGTVVGVWGPSDDDLAGDDPIGDPVVAHELPDVFLRVQFGTLGW